jgi:hypothetical protein
MQKTTGKENASGHSAKALSHSSSLKSSKKIVRGDVDYHHLQREIQQHTSNLNHEVSTAVSSKPQTAANTCNVLSTSLAVRRNLSMNS